MVKIRFKMTKPWMTLIQLQQPQQQRQQQQQQQRPESSLLDGSPPPLTTTALTPHQQLQSQPLPASITSILIIYTKLQTNLGPKRPKEANAMPKILKILKILVKILKILKILPKMDKMVDSFHCFCNIYPLSNVMSPRFMLK